MKTLASLDRLLRHMLGDMIPFRHRQRGVKIAGGKVKVALYAQGWPRLAEKASGDVVAG